MTKLYKVTVECTFFMTAEKMPTSYDVIDLGMEPIENAINMDGQIFTQEITDLKQVPRDWRNCLPWGEGNEEENTIEELLKLQNTPKVGP